MKVKMLIDVTGTFHNIMAGVERGDVVEVDDENGARYCRLGYAQSNIKAEPGPPYRPAT